MDPFTPLQVYREFGGVYASRCSAFKSEDRRPEVLGGHARFQRIAKDGSTDGSSSARFASWRRVVGVRHHRMSAWQEALRVRWRLVREWRCLLDDRTDSQVAQIRGLNPTHRNTNPPDAIQPCLPGHGCSYI